VFGVPQVGEVRYYSRVKGPQLRDDFACLVEPTHMRVAGGKNAIRVLETWILLDREQQFRHCLIEAPAEEMRDAYIEERCADSGARAEAQCGLHMLDRDVLAGPPTL
jgi:hypothetical protein